MHPFLNDEFGEEVASIPWEFGFMYFALFSSHVWVRIAQVRIVRMRKSCACAPSTYHVIDVCTAARCWSVDISPDRRVHVCISPDRRVHGSAARERRKNNKIINNNKNKMMKTLPKSKGSPTVVGYNDCSPAVKKASQNSCWP